MVSAIRDARLRCEFPATKSGESDREPARRACVAPPDMWTTYAETAATCEVVFSW